MVAADGSTKSAIAPPGIEERLQSIGSVPNRLRIINPFDPAVRDRKRLASLFGFDFRIEIYVPANQRRYGYYVCPLLEGMRFIGRIDIKANREQDPLDINGLWLEKGVRFGQGRNVNRIVPRQLL